MALLVLCKAVWIALLWKCIQIHCLAFSCRAVDFWLCSLILYPLSLSLGCNGVYFTTGVLVHSSDLPCSNLRTHTHTHTATDKSDTCIISVKWGRRSKRQLIIFPEGGGKALLLGGEWRRLSGIDCSQQLNQSQLGCQIGVKTSTALPTDPTQRLAMVQRRLQYFSDFVLCVYYIQFLKNQHMC